MTRKIDKTPEDDIPVEMGSNKVAEEFRQNRFPQVKQRCPACMSPMEYTERGGWMCTNLNCKEGQGNFAPIVQKGKSQPASKEEQVVSKDEKASTIRDSIKKFRKPRG